MLRGGSPVIEDIRQHHDQDDEQDNEGLEVVGQALELVNQSVVEEDQRSKDYENGEEILEKRIDLAEKLLLTEQPEME